jgi:hypothetical protein
MGSGLHLLLILAVTALFFAVVVAPVLGRILNGPHLGDSPCAPCGPSGMPAPRFHTDLFPPAATIRDSAATASGRVGQRRSPLGQAGPWDLPEDSENEGATDRSIDIDRVEGRLRAGAVGKINALIDRHPQAAAAVVRNWLHRNG